MVLDQLGQQGGDDPPSRPAHNIAQVKYDHALIRLSPRPAGPSEPASDRGQGSAARYCAYSTARFSRITVTRICPGYSISL